MRYDADIERVGLSTKRLEREPGDMLKNPAAVYAQAEETAKIFRCGAEAVHLGPLALLRCLVCQLSATCDQLLQSCAELESVSGLEPCVKAGM